VTVPHMSEKNNWNMETIVKEYKLRCIYKDWLLQNFVNT
jgi:hypothetical protein